jgi:hypothetical protein
MSETPEPLSFSCPRCSSAVHERFYGPCESCRGELGSNVSTVAHATELGRYVPKMNVVPNQVATKD